MKSFLTLKSVDEVLSSIMHFSPLNTEIISLDEAVDRHIAADWKAPDDLPGFDRSTVDGYAVRARDIFGANENSPAFLECVGHCSMGVVPDISIGEGQCAGILTGGMLPQGADSVVMVEYTREAEHNLVEIIRSQTPYDHVLMHNEDAAKDTTLITRGSILRPQEVGLLAAFGQNSVEVFRKPIVHILSTGDEVVPIENTPCHGQVRDVNAHSIMALCKQFGAIAVFGGLISDNPEKLKEAVVKAHEQADVVVVSGGSSAGMRDHTEEIFHSLPQSEILAHGVSISPGKPFILAESAGKCCMGLPGHVGGALICARVFLLPLLKILQGGSIPKSHTVQAILSKAVASAQGRRDYIRVKLQSNNGITTAEPISGPSGLISGLVKADALVICPETKEGFYAGERVVAEVIR